MFCNRVSIQCLRQAWVIITDAEATPRGWEASGGVPSADPQRVHSVDRQARERDVSPQGWHEQLHVCVGAVGGSTESPDLGGSCRPLNLILEWVLPWLGLCYLCHQVSQPSVDWSSE